MTRKTIPAHVEIVCDRCKCQITNGPNRVVTQFLVSAPSGSGATGYDGNEYDFCDPCMRVIVAAIENSINPVKASDEL